MSNEEIDAELFENEFLESQNLYDDFDGFDGFDALYDPRFPSNTTHPLSQNLPMPLTSPSFPITMNWSNPFISQPISMPTTIHPLTTFSSAFSLQPFHQRQIQSLVLQPSRTLNLRQRRKKRSRRRFTSEPAVNIDLTLSDDDENTANSSEPPTKKRRYDVIDPTTSLTALSFKQGTCIVCLEETELVRMPKYCSHPPMYCVLCARRKLSIDILDRGRSKFPCSSEGCTQIVRTSDALAILRFTDVSSDESQEDREKVQRANDILERLSVLSALEPNPHFRWCANGCGFGQIVEGMQRNSPYECYKCRTKMCFVHRCVWHNGLTCEQYDFQETQKRLQGGYVAQEVQGDMKPCPSCSCMIEKIDGCSVMKCCRYGTHGCDANVKKLGACDHGGNVHCGLRFCWYCRSEIVVNSSGGYDRRCPRTCSFFVG